MPFQQFFRFLGDENCTYVEFSVTLVQFQCLGIVGCRSRPLRNVGPAQLDFYIPWEKKNRSRKSISKTIQ